MYKSLLFLILSSVSLAQRCEDFLLQSFINGDIIAIVLQNSGRYLNELGQHQKCQEDPENQYTLQLVKNENVFKPKGAIYAIGTCMPKYCDSKQIQSLNSIIYPGPLLEFTEKSTLTFTSPAKDYENLNVEVIGYYIMVAFVVLIIIFNIFGMLVQYTTFGDLREKKKIIELNIPQNFGKHHLHNYQKLLYQVDKFLLNRKQIWAVFFLCFSIPRNTTVLFYDMEKSRKVGYLRLIKVIAFFWVCFDFTFFWAFQSYPINFNQYPDVMSQPISAIMLSGVIFGFDLLFFYQAFQIMYEKLKTIHLRKVYYNPFLYIIKMYLQYVIPVAVFIAALATIYPFIGSGPIFPHFVWNGVIQNCSNYWYANILMIQNFYPWSSDKQCGPHLVYLDNEFQLLIILIPLFLLVAAKTYWQVQLGTFLIISLILSIIPIIVYNVNYKITAFPGFLNEGYDYMYTRIWFRINPFLFGIALAIIKYEYKYGTLYQAKVRALINKLLQTKFKNWFCYILGQVLMWFPVLILLTDTFCIGNKRDIDYQSRLVSYCWGTSMNIIYNVLCQLIFFSGAVLFLLPTLTGHSTKLRSIMSSHLWHVLEELTFSAFLLSYIIISWYFISRENDILLSSGLLFQVSISSCIFSYIMALPFYLLIERPSKNILDLVLFPRRALFIKQKDVDNDSSEEDDQDTNDTQTNIKPQCCILSPQSKTKQGLQFTLSDTPQLGKQTLPSGSSVNNSCANCPIPIDREKSCSCTCKLTQLPCDCKMRRYQSQQVAINNTMSINNSIRNSTQEPNRDSVIDEKEIPKIPQKENSQKHKARKRVSFLGLRD